MRRQFLAVLVVLAAATSHGADAAYTGRNPFDFFKPTVVITPADLARLDHGEPLIRMLPAEGRELAVFAASRLEAPAEALVEWTRSIAELKRSEYVLAINRFSDPPRLEDLDRVALDADDLDAIRKCRLGDCEVKLSADEIQTMRVVISLAGAAWPEAVQQEFRRMLLARVLAYRPESANALLEGYPPLEGAVADSFYYWSKERYGAGKPVIALTHVQIVRPAIALAPQVMSFSTQIFATHYRDASLGVSAVVGGAGDGPRYLVYLNRSQVDVLGGLLGGLKRRLIESRMRSDSAAIVTAVRDRLESGRPDYSTP